jgi:hypothetical protein
MGGIDSKLLACALNLGVGGTGHGDPIALRGKRAGNARTDSAGATGDQNRPCAHRMVLLGLMIGTPADPVKSALTPLHP